MTATTIERQTETAPVVAQRIEAIKAEVQALTLHWGCSMSPSRYGRCQECSQNAEKFRLLNEEMKSLLKQAKTNVTDFRSPGAS